MKPDLLALPLALLLGACAPLLPPQANPAPAAATEGWIAPGPSWDTTTAGRDPAPVRLRVVGINDFHGNLRPHRPAFAEGREVGGAPALATYLRLAREAVEAPTLLLDGGDTMQGTPLSNLSFGAATVEFYDAAGFHAAALGNHEFDWGVEVLRERMEQAAFPWLAANLFVAGSDTLPSWARATHTVTLPGCAAAAPACDSVRVGIIGVATTATPRTTIPAHVVGFRFGDEARAIDRHVPDLRQQGAHFVIVAIHEGAYCAQGGEPCQGPVIEIAERLSQRPDLIVSGHSHTVLNLRAGGVPIVQAGSAGTRLSIVDLERISADSVSVVVREQPVTYTDRVDPDPAMAALLDRLVERYGPLLHEEITHLPEPLLRTASEYPLGNLIADAQRAATGVDIAAMNNGGIRTELRAGPVTYEDLFRVQPFANTLVTMDLTGAQVLAFLEQVLSRGRPDAHVSGIRVRYAPGEAAGDRLRAAFTDDGSPIDPARTYRVAVNNFMAEGGDGFTVLLEGANVENTGIVDLDALIRHLRGLPAPTLPGAGRFLPVP
jgi:2',3'-cyclic-nucleotide 2'-phosphodiesterase (5'-nucleotidase family)